MSQKVDVLVIGAGPGGYPTAIRAAQLDKSVILAEKVHIGGECLNYGCIPSKALISAADLYHRMNTHAPEMGITNTGTTVNMIKLQQWKNGVIQRLIGGIKQLLKAHKVKILMGTAKFLSPTQVEINLQDGTKEIIEPENVVIATGSKFIDLPHMKCDNKHFLDAQNVLDLDHVPEEFIVVGGGVIGIELGTAFAKLGSKVKIVELMPEILPGVEPSLVRFLKRHLRKLGIEIYSDSEATDVVVKGEKQEVEIKSKKQGFLILTSDKCLVSIGKSAVTSDLGLDKAGINTDGRGFILVNSQQQTNVPHIYAVGDCTGMPFLAHRATKQGTIAAETIAGEAVEYDFRAIPMVIFSDPEIATAGMTETEAIKAGHKVIKTRASFAASGKALAMMADDGFVNAIVDEDSGALLGVQIIGPHASDLISEVALALTIGATAEDIASTIHPHPTLPEMIMEALEASIGKAIHIPNPKKRK